MTDGSEFFVGDLEATIHHIEPKHGDMLFMSVPESTHPTQLAAIRRALHLITEQHFTETGARIRILVFAGKIEIQHAAAERLPLKLDEHGNLV